MVGNTRTTADTRRIRRLKTPDPIEVEASEHGVPLRLRLGRIWQDVTLTRRPWRIDQHWWRSEPVRRIYFRVAAQEAAPSTIYHDLIDGTWSRQDYS
jgi:hypothetical protein